MWPEARYMRELPRTVWAVLPNGKHVQIWVDRNGEPLEMLPPELEFDFRPINVSRTITPIMDELQLATLLALCKL